MNYLENAITCMKGNVFPISRAQKGAVIYHQNDLARFRFEVAAGVIRTTYLFADGRRQVTGFCFEGEVFGTDQGIYKTSAEVVSETARVRRFCWGDSAEDERALNKSLGLLENSILLIGRRTALSRVAAFLADIRLRTKGSQWIPLPMPRADIADYLGLTVETVSRMFSELRRKRLIAQLEDHLVQIIDQERLEALAGVGTDEIPPGHASDNFPPHRTHYPR
ncbi:helix-turn-helix domain-containing protein [Novosphingobium sp. PY1]|uniref:helix-turn-helix domain-containing protein n=1 Tax=Novosphingobium sp. PY1 TaxID=1882221 RepID=UPI001AA45B7F|nr:helix-turn-helix domain-containing protein [Novosphingobium sp. PY1]GFM28708.1 transcriptional regulator FixK [Novosphingobium sp. PY1]